MNSTLKLKKRYRTRGEKAIQFFEKSEKLPKRELPESKLRFFGVLTSLCLKFEIFEFELIIIDGIGHRDFFPLADWFNYFSKKKVERTFKRWKFNSLGEQREFLKSQKRLNS